MHGPMRCPMPQCMANAPMHGQCSNAPTHAPMPKCPKSMYTPHGVCCTHVRHAQHLDEDAPRAQLGEVHAEGGHAEGLLRFRVDPLVDALLVRARVRVRARVTDRARNEGPGLGLGLGLGVRVGVRVRVWVRVRGAPPAAPSCTPRRRAAPGWRTRLDARPPLGSSRRGRPGQGPRWGG